jgi:hypothetical protein
MMTVGKRIHHRVTWEPMTDPDEIIRSSIGGYPILPAGEPWPVCTEDGCGQKLAMFVQIELDQRFGLPFEMGSILNIFQCMKHDDPFEALDTQFPKKPHNRLPDHYWDHSNYAIFFSSPESRQQLTERDLFLGYSKLFADSESEPPARSIEALNYQNIKIGGSPFWVQKPKLWNCSCGASMEFVCSMPSNLQYPRTADSPRQPNGRANSHFLFLGLSTYVFACRARCHPRAVVAVRQN